MIWQYSSSCNGIRKTFRRNNILASPGSKLMASGGASVKKAPEANGNVVSGETVLVKD